VVAYSAALGNAANDATQAAAILKAAELTALSEQMRAAALRGEAVDPLALVRIEGAARRAVVDLGLDRKSASADRDVPSLAALLG
jgi:hypothetical protein